MTGTSAFAVCDVNGIPAAKPKTPFQLAFRPNPRVYSRYDEDIQTYEFFNFEEDEVLFEIWALEHPDPTFSSNGLHKIGAIHAERHHLGGFFKFNSWMDRFVTFQHITFNLAIEHTGEKWKEIVDNAEYQSNVGPENFDKVFDGVNYWPTPFDEFLPNKKTSLAIAE